MRNKASNTLASVGKRDVRDGSIATVWRCPRFFRFSPESRHSSQGSACLKGARSRHAPRHFDDLLGRVGLAGAKRKDLPRTAVLKRHNPPLGTKKQSSSPVFLLMNSTGKWSGVSSSLMMSGGTSFH